MDFSERMTLAPSETRVGDWMPWTSPAPAELTVTTLVSTPRGEFECAIEERLTETVACTRHSSRHSAPGRVWARVEMTPQREFRMRLTSHALDDIQLEVGLRGQPMP